MTLLPLIVERIKEQVEPFSHGGMGEHSVADLLVWKRAEHSHLQPGSDCVPAVPRGIVAVSSIVCADGRVGSFAEALVRRSCPASPAE